MLEQLNRQAKPSDMNSYLAQRLDGARDLYLLALALGERNADFEPFGRLIREARIHFEAVIIEARMAGFDTSDIGAVLAKHNMEMTHSVRPDLREGLERLLAAASEKRGSQR